MTTGSQPCTHPGCNGEIQDGFCSVCGLAPPEAPGIGLQEVSRRGTAALITHATGTSSLGAHSTGTSATGTGTAGTGTSGTGKSGASGRSRSRRGSTRSSRKQLGLGLVQLPELPPIDPTTTIMAEAVVPENKRFCASCDGPLKREKGFCPKCGTRYSFVPSLKAGDILADQYEVAGCMAFGGLGWIYLAKDKVLNRWVVLKGLLNSADEAAAAAAVAERQYLAAVKHPNIVGVYNFVQRGTEGYIVMEYVRGKTLRAIRKERGPLPVAEGIAYIHRILLAFAYLHRQTPALVYCDFKPENVMLEADDVKLIDMGGVRRIDDPGGDIYGTRGYSAPEAKDGPSVVTDLYTVARTLAVLITDFRGLQGTYEFSLPTPDEQPLFAQHDALYRLLLRATHKEPDQRFQNADEMAEQLAGVLREAVSTPDMPHPAESVYFGPDTLSEPPVPGTPNLITIDQFPGVKLDTEDPAASFVMNNSFGRKANQLRLLYESALPRFPESMELRLRLALAYIHMDQSDAGDKDWFARFSLAEAMVQEVYAADPFDWRIFWYRGLACVARHHYREAVSCFDAVYAELPGELVPKLALAMAYEGMEQYGLAIALYEVVVRTDPNFATACFGLARCRLAQKQAALAVAAYGRVPSSSSLYTQAQVAMARTLIFGGSTSHVAGDQELTRASDTLQALNLEGVERYRTAAEILHKTLDLLLAKKLKPTPGLKILGRAVEESSLRSGIEEALRSMAKLVDEPAEKIKLVDMANQVRPLSWV